MTLTERPLRIYSSRGADTYFGEIVTTMEHSLQAARVAQAADAPEALVIAALLHDIGHLVDSAADDITSWKTDARHEVTGSRWLAMRFGRRDVGDHFFAVRRNHRQALFDIRFAGSGIFLDTGP